MKGCTDHTSKQSPDTANAFGQNSAGSGNQGSDIPGKGQDEKVCHVSQAACVMAFCRLGHIALYKAINPTGKDLTHATHYSLPVHLSERLIQLVDSSSWCYSDYSFNMQTRVR
eukprot:scaffold681297_cov126-Prasinocladus_malaysianus.AAC.1